MDEFSGQVTHEVKNEVNKPRYRGQPTFFNAFQDNFLWMEEIGFYKTYVSSVINREILILRYIGSFFLDIEREERLEASLYIYPCDANGIAYSIRRIGLSQLIFFLSGCQENFENDYPDFWYPENYNNSAYLVSNKVLEYYGKINDAMRTSNVKTLYKGIRSTGIEFVKTLGQH